MWERNLCNEQRSCREDKVCTHDAEARRWESECPVRRVRVDHSKKETGGCGCYRPDADEPDNGDACRHKSHKDIAEDAGDEHGEETDKGLKRRVVLVILVVELNPESPCEECAPVGEGDGHHCPKSTISTGPKGGFD